MTDFYQLLFEKNPLPMWVYDAHTLRLLAANEAALGRYGYDKKEFLSLTFLDLHHPDHVTEFQEHIKEPLLERVSERHWRHKSRQGELIEVETLTREIEFAGKRARMVLVKDLTESRRLERKRDHLAKRLAVTLESISDSFFTLDRDWRITYLNAHAEAFFGLPRDTALGSSLWAIFPEAVNSVFQEQYEQAMRRNEAVHFAGHYAPSGAWVEVNAYPSKHGLSVYFRDVTDRHTAAQLMHEERETFSAVLNATSDAIISIDVEGTIRMFNPGAERVFRRTRASMVGENVEILLPERYRAAHRQHRRRFVESGTPSRMMGLGLVKGLRSDGQELDMEGTISQLLVHQQQVLMVSLRDVTERVQDHQALEQSKAQLTELTTKLLSQEKMLVKRLSQVLHYQLGQTMTAIRMIHETIMASQRATFPVEIERMERQLGALIGQAIRQIRQVLMDLRPPLLEEQGLVAALDNELRNRALTKPEVDISIHVSPETALMRWPGEVEYAAFMIAREAVENSLRHSGATAVSVRLLGRAMSLHLKLTDNGVGFTDDTRQNKGHLGILGMHERANAIGAKVSIDSKAGQGTIVNFDWEPAA
jgi:PAS domain S-box-containing protein